MRPHRLRLVAFGPFPDTVDLDLDEVSGAGPFLMRGATGAGKTSLLDAVGYALFGKVPGARGLKQLRSDHATDTVRTSVELWATVAGRAVHVVRSPDQRRPRSRGTGWTTDKASVSVRVARDLAALDADDCEARWVGVQEANAELAELVGMTHEQFVQVVLLPQGDFARFLRAKDDDRAVVLRALFETSRFAAVEQHLRTRSDRARAALGDAEATVARAAARVAAHVGVDEPPATGLRDWATGLRQVARDELVEASQQSRAAAEDLEAVRAEHGSAAVRARLLGELVDATGTRRALLQQAGTVADQAEQLDAADRAAEVVALHRAHVSTLHRTRQHAAAASAALADLAVGRGALPTVLPDVLVDLVRDARALADHAEPADIAVVAGLSERLDTHLSEASAANARLEALGRDVSRRRALVDELGARREERDAAALAAREVRARADELPGRLQQLTAEAALVRDDAAGLDAAERDVGFWRSVLDRADDLAEHVRGLDTAERDDLEARRVQRAAEQVLDDLRRARLDGMSGELAGTLVEGEPCCVCGATEHPAPAAGTGPGVGADDEDRARALAAEAAGRASTTRAEVARLRARRDDCHGQVADQAGATVDVPDLGTLTEVTVAALREALSGALGAARTRLVAAQRSSGRAAVLETRLDALRVELSQLDDALATAERGHHLLAAAVEALQGQVDDLTSQLRAALAGPAAAGPGTTTEDLAATWAARARAGVGHHGLVRAACEAVDGWATSLDEVRRTRAHADAAGAEAGWSDTAAAAAAARPRAWRDETRRAVAAHERDLHASLLRLHEIRAGLAGQGVEVLDEDVGLALEAATRDEQAVGDRLQAADSARREADGTLERTRTVLAGLDRTVPRLVEADGSTGPLRSLAQAARALADLCCGTNDKSIPLSTYVLAAHLEQVVQAANQRLHGMSDGRYALVHVEEGEDRRRRAGLGLAVLDAWTGRQRPAGTLSGGETFLASLALALGLADVVTAEAGGARIDALFVDEGFGTLDADSLDRAMDVLDQLQEHGRLVGVVSHVGELQQRLPRQVHVEHGRNGSTVRVLTG